jgi:hypothetical protein
MTFVASRRIRSVGCVYAHDAAFTHMCLYAAVGAYTQVRAYTRVGAFARALGAYTRGGAYTVTAHPGAYTRVGPRLRER